MIYVPSAEDGDIVTVYVFDENAESLTTVETTTYRNGKVFSLDENSRPSVTDPGHANILVHGNSGERLLPPPTFYLSGK